MWTFSAVSAAVLALIVLPHRHAQAGELLTSLEQTGFKPETPLAQDFVYRVVRKDYHRETAVSDSSQ